MKNSVRLDDSSLEKIAGGSFGPTEHLVKVTAANFDSIIRSAPIVLVTLGASWAGPCQMLNDVLNQLAAESEGSAIIGVIDVDADEKLAKKLGVNVIPTTIKFVNGRETERITGYQPIDSWRGSI